MRRNYRDEKKPLCRSGKKETVRVMPGRMGVTLAAAGACLWLNGCSAVGLEETAMESGTGLEETSVEDTADPETERQEDMPDMGREESGRLRVAGPEGEYFLYYTADCPDGIHYRVEICDESGGVLQELACDVSEEFVEIRHGGDEYWLYEDSMVRTGDVDGDGTEDLWLYQGMVTCGYSYWACYVYEGETRLFDRVEGFEQLRDPYVDGDGLVSSDYCAGVTELYWEKYSVREGRLVPEGKLTEYSAGDDTEFLYDEEVYEDGLLTEILTAVPGTEVENTALWGELLR